MMVVEIQNSLLFIFCYRRSPRHVALQLFRVFLMCGNHFFTDLGCRQTGVDPVWTVFRKLRAGELQQAPCGFIHGFPVQNISRKLRLFFQDPHEL